MTNSPSEGSWRIDANTAGKTVSAALRVFAPGCSWRQIKKLIETRRVTVNERLCMDEARRLVADDQLAIVSQSLDKPPRANAVIIRHIDEDLVVVEKPAGVISQRHHSEIDWPAKRRLQKPTLEEMILQKLPRRKADCDPVTLFAKQRRKLIRCVHRLDQDTSGLLVFARTEIAEKDLVSQFAEHSIERIYTALVWGTPKPGRIESRLVRDRGDGLRGSTSSDTEGKPAATIIRSVKPTGEYSVVECQLETGRTHQIRIHLAEKGHPVCGDSVYRSRFEAEVIPDSSRASRLALHARRLVFVHPVTRQSMEFEAALPKDLSTLIASLRY